MVYIYIYNIWHISQIAADGVPISNARESLQVAHQRTNRWFWHFSPGDFCGSRKLEDVPRLKLPRPEKTDPTRDFARWLLHEKTRNLIIEWLCTCMYVYIRIHIDIHVCIYVCMDSFILWWNLHRSSSCLEVKHQCRGAMNPMDLPHIYHQISSRRKMMIDPKIYGILRYPIFSK